GVGSPEDITPAAPSTRALALLPRERTLAVGATQAGKVYLCDLGDHPRPREVTLPRQTRAAAVAFHPRRKLLAVAGPDGVDLWDVLTRGREAERTGGLTFERKPFDVLAFNSDGDRLAGGNSAGAVVVWQTDPAGGRPIFRQHTHAITALTFAGPRTL